MKTCQFYEPYAIIRTLTIIQERLKGNLGMEKTDQQIYEEFASQLCQWGENGTAPVTGNQDISYGLELQKKRLQKHHTKMEFRLTKRQVRQGTAATAVFSDTRYTNKLVWNAFHRETDYYRDGKKCLTVGDDEQLYTVITWLNNQEDIQTSYVCPNCGAISAVGVLLEGCPYCHTRFFMSDLFPKVTNYYFLPDYGMGEQEARNRVGKWMAAGGAISFLLRLPGLVLDMIHGENLFLLLITLVFTVGVGAVFGYFALSIRLLVRVFGGAFKMAPRAAGQISAKKRLTDFMKQFDPGFTFEYFFGKVQGLLKILIFTNDRSRLAVYDGPEFDGSGLDNIVDAQFDGAVSLNGSRIEGEYCHLDLNVYMTDVYCQGGGLKRTSDCFQVGLCRNISRPQDYGFSVKKVSCRNCGASFDATKERFCPFCRTRYELREDDWVITFIRKR